MKREKSVSSRSVESHPDARDRLVKAGTKLFAESGLDGTTVRELAEKAGVNISLVSYHFNGKEGLYKACLEAFHQRRLVTAVSVLQPPESNQEVDIRLGIFIDEIIASVVEEPELSMMLHRELESESPHGVEIFKEVFQSLQDSLLLFLKSAQKSGFVRKDLDPKIATYLFFGNIAHIARTSLRSTSFFGSRGLKDSKIKKNISRHLHSMFLGGILGRAEIEK